VVREGKRGGTGWYLSSHAPGFGTAFSAWQSSAMRFETQCEARSFARATGATRIVRLVPKRRPMPNLDGWARDTEATQQKVAKSLREASPYDAQRQYEEQRLQNLRAAQPPPSHATVAEVRELIEKRARAEEREAICRFLEDDSMGWRKAAEWIRVHGEAISRSFRSGAHRSGAK
jgi:hypothetical protein